LGRGEAVSLHHAPVRHVAGLDARLQVGARHGQVRGDGTHARHHRPPFALQAVASLALVAHALEEPIDAAERLVDVGVEGAVPVLPLLVLVDHEVDLMEGGLAVHAAGATRGSSNTPAPRISLIVELYRPSRRDPARAALTSAGPRASTECPSGSRGSRTAAAPPSGSGRSPGRASS